MHTWLNLCVYMYTMYTHMFVINAMTRSNRWKFFTLENSACVSQLWFLAVVWVEGNNRNEVLHDIGGSE